MVGRGPKYKTTEVNLQGELKVAYLVRPLARDPIKTFEPLAARLVEYALVEQTRVRAGL